MLDSGEGALPRPVALKRIFIRLLLRRGLFRLRYLRRRRLCLLAAASASLSHLSTDVLRTWSPIRTLLTCRLIRSC